MGWFKRMLGEDTEVIPTSGVDAPPRRQRRDFKVLYPRDMLLEVVVTGNPKRNGSEAAKRFELYKGASTVGEALDAGVLYKDIDYDWTSNYIALDGARVIG